jgi:hypothetical protein
MPTGFSATVSRVRPRVFAGLPVSRFSPFENGDLGEIPNCFGSDKFASFADGPHMHQRLEGSRIEGRQPERLFLALNSGCFERSGLLKSEA